MGIEDGFDVSFVAKLTSEEKQIQQNYRPIIGVHKWFARRPGALFRSLLLSEFAEGRLEDTYFSANTLTGITVGDPFMGGGTTIFECNRVGCNTIGFDINPMAYWVVRQELAVIDRIAFRAESERIIAKVEKQIGDFYKTECRICKRPAVVKYFLWVKQTDCGGCQKPVDLFPGYLVADKVRHPSHVLHCPHCKELVEIESLEDKDVKCPNCLGVFCWSDGSAKKQRYACPTCKHEGKYPEELRTHGAPKHRLFGIEYHCADCKKTHAGRFFKTPDERDVGRFLSAANKISEVEQFLPDEAIPDGDETKRLHRWGYSKYREMFNDRQLLALGLLSNEIMKVEVDDIRHALATVFSDFLRYQNMLCRYDTYALKCQDVFAVHGFPVGLLQCENNVLGIVKIGSGGFRHFIEKFDRAKAYGENPFETIKRRKSKEVIPIVGERIAGNFVSGSRMPKAGRGVWITAGSVNSVKLKDNSLDAVFTDPPYFDNVQYAELMDFCFVWLRRLLRDIPEFGKQSTRSVKELTGNVTTGKGLIHFTEGLSSVFVTTTNALKPGGPFAFTYHHNRPEAYSPIIVAILNAHLDCTTVLPCPAEMSASMHISGTSSSVLDSIFVCRKLAGSNRDFPSREVFLHWLEAQSIALTQAGLKLTRGDLRCTALGYLAKATANRLAQNWDDKVTFEQQLSSVTQAMIEAVDVTDFDNCIDEILLLAKNSTEPRELVQARLFD